MTHDGNRQSLLQKPGKMTAKTQLFRRARRRPSQNLLRQL